MRVRAIILMLSLGGVGGAGAVADPSDPVTASVWHVVSSGLSAPEAGALAAAFGVPSSLQADGSFRYVSPSFGDVATVPAALGPGTDEDGRPVVASAPNLAAILATQPIGDDAAKQMTEARLRAAGLHPDGDYAVNVLHTELSFELPARALAELVPGAAPGVLTRMIDTTVTYTQRLDGIPLEGPGARLRVTYAPDGRVTELRWSARRLAEGPSFGVVSRADAAQRCAAHYPPRSTVRSRLVYWTPPLSERIGTLYPHWECAGTDPGGNALLPAVVPAADGAGPTAGVSAGPGRGGEINGTATARGGTPPYRYRWTSMTTDLDPRIASAPTIAYTPQPRGPIDSEKLQLTVTDANGLSDSLYVIVPTPPYVEKPDTTGANLAVGGDFTVYEWGCVQASSAGFKQVFDSNGVSVAFRWNGYNAWESDFKESGAPQGGDDADFADDVDLAWYTGHGGPGSFSFDNTDHDDGSIVPGDGRWGDRDLEWLQLESCEVLKTSAGGMTVGDRWGPTLDGLHLLNGFDTVAQCVDNTAGTFAQYLFHPLKVRQAWAQMALDLEPPGRAYVTMGALRASDLAWNFDDYFWSQGPVGPDISASETAGYYWLKGTT